MNERPSRSADPIVQRPLRGVTLIELLIVATILGILAVLVLTSAEPAVADQLHGAAQVVVADVAYVRSLAVSNSSPYRLTFEATHDRYYLEHSGTNSQLDNLPDSPFRAATDGPDRQTTDLSRLPSGNGSVELLVVYRVGGGTAQSVTELEIGPLGALTQPESTVIWLACGGGSSRRYIPVHVNPITGIADVGELQANNPLDNPADATPEEPVSGEQAPSGQ
jgi:prepilin-type N-terminal cleavage/methylation domain-containing protein